VGLGSHLRMVIFMNIGVSETLIYNMLKGISIYSYSERDKSSPSHE
jgi:hypothetical protein